MSMDLNLEEGAARQFSGEPRNKNITGSGEIQRCLNSGIEIQESRSIREIPKYRRRNIVIKHLLCGKKILDPQGAFGKWICLILCVIAISLDPLFFYIPVINDNKKCIGIDKKLGIMASVLRSVFDFFYIIYVIIRLHSYLFAPWSRCGGVNSQKNGRKHLFRFFLVELLAILPLPQVVVLIIVPMVRGSNILEAMTLLKFCILFQCVPRVIRIYPLFTKATRTSGKLAGATWLKAAFNLLLYMFAAHVFGALWYFFAIERETICWKKACINHTGCSHRSFSCDDNLGYYSFVNDFCPTKTQDTTTYDFGIFHDALKFGIVEVTDFPRKFSYCFRWGLQNLSCFGQNLPASTYVWDNFFATFITISGLVLFLFLIGNMQIYLQSKTARSEEMRLKGLEIDQWMPFRKLSENLRKQVKKHQRYIWRETSGVDVENLLNNLPKGLRRNIKRELCLDLLKKVEEFKKLDEATLDALCDCVKPAFYINKRTYIVREGEPIDEMLFVVQGKLWTYTSRDRTNRSASLSIDHHSNKSRKGHLEDGDFCGEEIVAWALCHPSSSNLPISTRTIQALTKVEAFSIIAEDLKNVFIKYRLSSSSELSMNHWITQAARVIQETWRCHHTRRNSRRSNQEMESAGLQVALSHGASLPNALRGGGLRSSERTPPTLSHRRAGPEITLEER